MSVETSEDRLSYLNASEFAVTATVYAEGGTRQVVGILDTPEGELSLSFGALSSRSFTFTAREEDLQGVKNGDRFEVAGQPELEVFELRSDGTGMVEVGLHKRND